MDRQQLRASGSAGDDATETPAASYAAGLRHLQAGQIAAAEARCRQVLASDPRHADSLHLLGLIHAQQSQVDLAIDFIAQAIRIDQGNPDYFSNLGTLLALRDRFDEALKSYDIALKLKPDFVEVWVRLGDLLGRLKRFEETLLTYDHALTLDPHNAAAAGKAARLLAELRRFEEAALAHGRWVTVDPANYEAHNGLGTVLVRLGRFEEAAGAFRNAAEVKPDAPAAFNNLGIALTHLRRFDEAVSMLDRAIALAPDLAEPYNAKANALKGLNRLDEALENYDRALALRPDYAEAHGNRGTCLDDLARPDEALASYRHALVLQGDHGDTHWNLAVNRLRAGDLGNGWAEAEWRWQSSSLRLKRRAFDEPLWLGAEPIQGKTLLVHNEQGLGDAIQFCRYIPLLAARGARVILEVDRPLKELLAGLGGVSLCLAQGEALPAFDFHCPLASLPLSFDTALDTIPSATPYLSIPNPARDWLAWLGSRGLPRVGLVWSGNPNHLNDHNRSIPLQALGSLFDVEAQFVSLQKDARPGDRAFLPGRPDILDAAPEIESFADTASLMAQLDLVISVDTSVAHLAGALGKPVFVLLPYVADWRWLTGRADSPWYPTARLFRQSEIRNWASVVTELRETLRRFVAAAPH